MHQSESLLAKARDDLDAFAGFYDAYSSSLLGWLVRRLADPDAALDLMSETFLIALEHRRQFRGETAAEERAWLFTIARHQLYRYWRTGVVQRHALARLRAMIPAQGQGVEEGEGVAALAQDLVTALRELTPDTRRAVELRVFAELSYAEISSRLRISEPTARTRVSRGLRALRCCFSGPDALQRSL